MRMKKDLETKKDKQQNPPQFRFEGKKKMVAKNKRKKAETTKAESADKQRKGGTPKSKIHERLHGQGVEIKKEKSLVLEGHDVFLSWRKGQWKKSLTCETSNGEKKQPQAKGGNKTKTLKHYSSSPPRRGRTL